MTGRRHADAQGSPGRGGATRDDCVSAASLIHQHGYRWDEDGYWPYVDTPRQLIDQSARPMPGDVLLVDEDGMLDQDTARSLFALAERASSTIALIGDGHQLPAVVRGGVLDLAVRWSRPESRLELDSVHRFTDPAYAVLSLLMCHGERAGEPVTNRGERIGLGDRIAARCNDRELGVANRDTWVVAGIGDDGSLLGTERGGQRELPAA